MTNAIFSDAASPRREIIFDVAGCVRPPSIRTGNYKLIGKELYDVVQDPGEKKNVASEFPDTVSRLQARLKQAASERPPLGDKSDLMTPALPWVYGQQENENVPDWVKVRVQKVRDTQPKSWAPGKTPWPQAPKDGKIIYSGDGR